MQPWSEDVAIVLIEMWPLYEELRSGQMQVDTMRRAGDEFDQDESERAGDKFDRRIRMKLSVLVTSLTSTNTPDRI